MYRSRSILLALSVIASTAAAQVPQGWGAYSRLWFKSAGATPSGVTVFAPFHGSSRCRTAKPFMEVTNLPAPLAVKGGGVGGANAIAVRESDGSLVVGEITTSGGEVAIYHLRLAGMRVFSARKFTLGKSKGVGGVHQIAWLPDGKVLFAHAGVPGNGIRLPAQGIATLDLATGKIRSIPIQGFPKGSINAATVDRQGKLAYFGNYQTKPTRVFQIWSVRMTGGAPVQVGPNLPDGMYQLEVDHAGTVWVSCWNKGLFSYDRKSKRWINRNLVKQLNATAIDPVSGELVQASVAISKPSLLQRWTAAGGLVLIPGMPGKDLASGMAIRSSLIASGAQGGGSAPYVWRRAPNPGGAPLVGNRKFSLTQTTRATPGASVAVFADGLAGKPIPIFGKATLLLDPKSIVLVTPMLRKGSEISTPLPIPPITQLCGIRLYSQVFHIEGSSLVSSRALSIRLL